MIKTLQQILTAKQEIILAAIHTARDSRSKAEAISTKMEKLDAKLTKLNNERYALWQERERLISVAITCEGLSDA